MERERARERESERAREKLVSIQLPHSPLGIIHTCSHIQSQAHFVLAEFCACHQQLAFRRVALFLCSFFFFAVDTILQKRDALWGRRTSAPSLHTQARKKDGKEEVAKRHRARHNTAASGKRFRNSTEHAMERPHVRRIKPSCYIHGLSRRKKKGGIRKRKKQGKNKKKEGEGVNGHDLIVWIIFQRDIALG